jgi:hypothetical protein
MTNKKRKPRLNEHWMGLPYRYVRVKIKSVEKVEGEEDTYKTTYTIAKGDYYYEKYLNEEFTEVSRCSSKPYRVGKIYTFPLSIDIDDWLAKN